ncbi:MAG: TenA family transcriptional regulator [Candidatus Binatia bacterium]
MEKLGDRIKEIALKLVYLEPASFNRVKPGELTKEGGRVFVQQFSHFTRRFPRWLAAVAANCPEHDVRKFLAGNIYEEEIGESGQGSHYELLVRQGMALGLTREEIDRAEPLSSTLLAINAIENVCRNHSWLEGLAATTGLECVNHPAVRRKGGTIIINDVRAWQHLGLSDHQLRSRTVHMEGDEGHAEEGLRMLAQYAPTNELQEKAVSAASCAILAFRTLVEGIGREALPR